MKKVLSIFVLFVFCISSYADDSPFEISTSTTTTYGYATYSSSYESTESTHDNGLATSEVSEPSSEPSVVTTSGVYAKNTETFILVNMDFLPNDIAAGAGDTISALAVLMEVEDVESFGKKLQANFEVIYPRYDVDYMYVTEAIASL